MTNLLLCKDLALGLLLFLLVVGTLEVGIVQVLWKLHTADVNLGLCSDNEGLCNSAKRS